MALELNTSTYSLPSHSVLPPFATIPATSTTTNYFTTTIPTHGTKGNTDIFIVVKPPPKVELAVDANRDGTIVFPSSGDTSDVTSSGTPYRFWLNNDNDIGIPGADVVSTTKNCDSDYISSVRDLEDFAQLAIKIDQRTVDLLKQGGKLSIETTGGLGVKVFHAVGSGTDYLFKQNTAFAQALGNGNEYRKKLDPKDLTATFDFIHINISSIPLLFEGVSSGNGILRLVLKDSSGKQVAKSEIYLKLLDIKEMYVRAKASPYEGLPSPYDNPNPPDTSFDLNDAGFAFSKPPDEEKNVIIFVHGIHPPLYSPDFAYKANLLTAESNFKRLWWAGYKGRFALFKWPALNPLNTDGLQYNESEFRAFKYGKGLALFAASQPSDYTRHIFAHSQGNAVTGAAFRDYGLNAKTWMITEGAIPISCYDANPAFLIFPYTTPDLASNFGYRGYLQNITAPRVVNFFNRQDSVTGRIYNLNQNLLKPTHSADGLRYIKYFILNWTTMQSVVDISNYGMFPARRPITSLHESMSMVVQSRSEAIGQGLGVQGIIDSPINLNIDYGFGDSHGAQWEYPFYQNALPYYQRMIDEIKAP